MDTGHLEVGKDLGDVGVHLVELVLQLRELGLDERLQVKGSDTTSRSLRPTMS